MEQERINANVNELSKKLLEGCKLLSESCPETNVPLVSTADGRMYSVGNGAYYVRNGGELHKVLDMPRSAPSSPGKVNSPSRFITAATGAPPGSVARPETPTVAAPNGESLSSRVAAKLLEGFTLLSESCPVTSVPLVQDQQGRILSVGTGVWYERTGGQLIEAAAPSAPLTYYAQAGEATPTFQGMRRAGELHGPDTASRPRPYATPLQPTSMPPSPAVHTSAANAAVTAALLSAQAHGTPLQAPAPSSAYRPPSSAATKVAVQEAIALLSSRLGEATSTLASTPIRDAGAPVSLIKDIALAIGALRAL